MPMVTATPVSERDDDEVQHRTYFIGLANTANNSYTYPTTQEMLIVRNRSDTESLTLTVNGSSYTIPKGGSKEIATSFTTFSIASTSNSQAFDATAIKAVSSKSSGGTGVLVVANLTELQASYPNGALAPVWVTSENSWYYWSGAVPTPDTTPPTVTASLSTGTYVGTQSVNLAANESATIYYTTDGSTPNTGSAVYSAAISISASTVLKYYGVDTAGNSSAVQTATYTITQPDTTPPDAPTNFAAGTPTSNTVPLTWTASVASDLSKYEIAYSIDGTSFTVASSNVTGTSATVTGLTANTAYTFRITAIDTSSNRSTAVTTTATTAAAASGTIVVSDTFNRADGALGNAETGQTWTVGTGNVATVISNQVGFVTGAASYPNITIAQSDNIDIEMDLILPTLLTGSISGVSARVGAGNNQALIFGALTNGTKAGFLTTLSGATAVPANVNFTFVAGQTYRLKLEVRGNVYKGYIDGVLIQTYTDTANVGLTNAKHGFVFYSTNVPRGDNFKITAY